MSGNKISFSFIKKILLIVTLIMAFASPAQAKEAKVYFGGYYLQTNHEQVRPQFKNHIMFQSMSISSVFYNLYMWHSLYLTQMFQRDNLFQKDTSRYRPAFLKTPDIDGDIFRYDNNKLNRLDSIDIYKREDKIDTLGQTVESKETVGGVELGSTYLRDLDTYLKKKKEFIQRGVWDSVITTYDMKKALSKGDLANMLAQSTGITIPLPPNPVIGIFGKPQIRVNVHGQVNLRVGWRWDSQNLGTVSAFGQTQSSPIFNQDIKVGVNAQIGDKLKLVTDWDTKRMFEFQNKFKIGYEGEDDEIIKLVEVGNVNLPLESTLISGGEALFGVRADFQFGPLYLKTLFSQRKGQKKFVDVRGGASRQYFNLRAYDYAKNHFFIDTAYKAVYDDYFKSSTPVASKEYSHLRVKEIEVWEATNKVDETRSAISVAHANLPGLRRKLGEFYTPDVKNKPIQSGIVERGRFVRLDSNKYSFDFNLGTLSIHNLRPDRYYAVSYRIEGPTTANEDDIYVGDMSYLVGERDSLILKLIYRPNMQPGFTSLWERQMKNIYSINSSNVNTTDTKIGLWYIRQSNDSTDVIEGSTEKLVTIFGVDRVNNSTGTTPPDGVFDLREPFFDARRGEITFPSTEPFGDGLRAYFSDPKRNLNPGDAENYVFDAVYDTTYDVARRNTARDRFMISGEVTGKQTNRIFLGGYNIASGSVRVTLDGRPLKEYQDYIIDYYSGMLTLKNDRATLPNANLKIEYEQQDIFNVSTRTLAGIRADYKLFEKRNIEAVLGMTFMHYDQSAVVDRVRLGDEPVSNSMLGFDAKLNMKAPWLTKALDALPFYDTKAESSINLRGEWAMILPTPNKRKSTILSDNGSAVVYIDDFDAAQRHISLGMNSSLWSHSSQPEDIFIGANDSVRSDYRARTFWFQYFIPSVPTTEVWPNRKDVQQGNRNISPLHVVFEPEKRGIYNKNPLYLDSENPEFNSSTAFWENESNMERIWGGMMRLFSSFNTNFDTENIEYIELMMKVDHQKFGNTKMFIDIGQISEDIIPNQALDTEDGITEESTYPNNIIDSGEDLGIDALSNAQEKEIYPYPLNLEEDPARDDYDFDFQKDDRDREENDFVKYNNYEGNSLVSELGQFPDTEVLNRNNGQTVSLDNSYFTYEVNLDTRPTSNPQIKGSNNGWNLYRIPIRKPTSKVGNPLFSNIQYIRVRFQGGVLKARIADWRLVGSQWQRINNFQDVASTDSVMQLAFVNLWDNSGAPDYYSMPPGVEAPRQLNNPDATQDIRLNEQSLSVSVTNLRYGEERMAVRIFQPLDIFYYKKLKLFVHGDGSMPAMMVPGAVPKANFFIRFGIDSSNYYEYRRPLVAGWQDIEIDLTELTAIKQLRDTAMLYDRQYVPVKDDELAYFYIKGNPILTRVNFFGLGIANPADRFPNELTTTMWVDEMRLLEPENRADWAAVGNVNIKLADLGNINASFERREPNFHQLEDRFGDRVSQTNWTVSMDASLDKFAPKSMSKMKLPITYTHSEFLSNPEYEASNDIKLERAAEAAYSQARRSGYSDNEARQISDRVKVESQSLRVQDSWAVTSMKLGLPVDHWLVDKTLNGLTFGYSYAQEFERSPIYEQKFNWQWRFNAKYDLAIPDLLSVQPLGFLKSVPVLDAYSEWKINFLPNAFNAGLDLNRRRQTEKSRFLDYPSPVFRDFTAIKSASFNWKISEGGLLSPEIQYSVNTNSTLVPYELDENGIQRSGSELWQYIFSGGINLGLNNLHSQNININFKPTLPNLFGLTEYFKLTGSYNVNYQWQNPMQPDPAIRDIVKNASYNASLRFKLDWDLMKLGEEWLGGGKPKQQRRVSRSRNQDKKDKAQQAAEEGGFWNVTKGTIRNIFFDWQKVTFSFNQNNTANNPGVYGGTGMTNFWGRGLAFRDSKQMYGPSFAYQLGLVSNPHGGFRTDGFGFETYPGLRPADGVMQDSYNQTTNLKANTSRPLWEGATLNLEWNTDFGYSRNQTVVTDENGVPEFTNIMATENFKRSYISFPSFFGFNLFSNTIDHVIDLYEQRKPGIVNSTLDTVSKNQALQNALSESFYEGLEAFSLFGKGAVGKFLPALNWEITWEGMEKFPLWSDWIDKMRFQHKYKSTYSENVLITDNGRAVQNQVIEYEFAPLFGWNMTFDEDLLDGILTAEAKFSTKTSYNLNSANRSTITRQQTDDITIRAGYTMKGFEFPLFGLVLKNDLEYAFLFTYKNNSSATYDILDRASLNDNEGRTLNGNKQIILEPSARYSISDRFTAALFFRYEGTFTEGAASPGFHTTQVGLDIRMSIAGGR